MTVYMYEFAKPVNSTKQPSSVSFDILTCELKANTSMTAPVLLIKGVPNNWSTMWNYVYILDFQRFYFINDWTWVNGVWECSCLCDVMASFKTDIGNLSEYVLRSSYEWDRDIIDSAYVTTCEISAYMDQPTTKFFHSDLTQGFYLIGVIGNETTATQGAITYYQMTAAELATLREFLLSDVFLQNAGLANLVDFVPADAVKVIYNPFQYITSCVWYPFPASAISNSYKTAVTSIDFGWWTVGVGITAYRLNQNVPVYHVQETMTLRSHPEEYTRGAFLNHSPFTVYKLSYPPFEEIQIPDQYFDAINNKYLEMHLEVDFISGIGYLNLYSRSTLALGVLVARLSQRIAIDIQLAQIATDYLGSQTTKVVGAMNLTNELASAAGSFEWYRPFTTAAKASAQASTAYESYKYTSINDYMKAAAPQLLTSGANGSLAAYKQEPYLLTTFYLQCDDDSAQIGRPLCKVKTLNTIPGYIMCKNPEVNIACMASEKEVITGFLTSGFFYE